MQNEVNNPDYQKALNDILETNRMILEANKILVETNKILADTEKQLLENNAEIEALLKKTKPVNLVIVSHEVKSELKAFLIFHTQ